MRAALFFLPIGWGEIRLATGWPVWTVFVTAIVAGLLVMALYVRETRVVQGPLAWILPGIRGTTVSLAILMLASPVWHRSWVVGSPTRVVFAVDRSASMASTDTLASPGSELTADRDARPSRLDRAADRLLGSATRTGWVEALSETHRVDVMAFSAGPPELVLRSNEDTPWRGSAQQDMVGGSSDEPSNNASEASADWRKATGEGTDLGSPIQAASQRSRSSEPPDESPDSDASARSVLVLITDGQDTQPKSQCLALAQGLRDEGWQIHTLGMGSTVEPPDVAILQVDTPERVANDGRLAGTLRVKHTAMQDRSLLVRIRRGDETVWSSNLLVADGDESTVPFDFPVESISRSIASEIRGVDQDTVVLPLRAEVLLDPKSVNEASSTSQTTQFSDSFDFRVAAASRDRRLLILDGSSRWETRYLRNLFQRDPAWSVNTVLFGPGTDETVLVRGDSEGKLPENREVWSEYDAVILGEIPPDQWTEEDMGHLRDFVRQGGGLIFLDGRYGRLASLSQQPMATPLESDLAQQVGMQDLLPVRYAEGFSASNGDTWKAVTQVSPTEMGRTHPVMRVGASDSGDTSLWSALPSPQRTPLVESMPDAETWAESILPSGASIPWLVTRLYGSGRVFYIATDQTWRWRYKVESRLHGRFWNQLLTAAMQPPYAVADQFVAIGTDQVDYETGQQVTIRARLLPRDGLAALAINTPSGASSTSPTTLLPTVDAVLIRDEAVVATVPMNLDDANRRTYVAQTAALPAGAYRVRIRASGYDAAAMRASTPFWIQPPRRGERNRVALNEPLLQRIAATGEGTFVHESSAEDLLELLKPVSNGRIMQADLAIWQSWWWFGLLLLLLAIEWCLRKKAGLL
ncbi:MAG: vWA domain-containing protein [Planctomycetota bacterium]